MKYALLYYETAEETARRESDAPAYWESWNAYIGAINEAGIFDAGQGLQASSVATTLRLIDGKHQVQDGPFADVKEQLGGFVIIDVPSLDEALKWAGKAPCASAGSVEVRPVLTM